MPTIKPFSQELQSTDMIFGTSKGIESLYKVYAEKGVSVDRGNKGAEFATNQTTLDRNQKRIPKEPLKLTQATFSAAGIKKNQEYLAAFPQLPKKYVNSITATQVITNGIGDRTIRRKCKSILYWQLIIKGLRVQFVLSGLDMNAVPNKQICSKSQEGKITYLDKGSSSREENKDAAITDAELRWVFRNRELAKVQKGVQFWKTSDATDRYGRPIPCEAPWDMEDSKAAWKEYGLSVQKKRFQELRKFWEPTSPDLAADL